MDKPKVFVTHVFLGRFLSRLKEKYDLVVYSGKNITRSELLEGVKGAVGIVSLLTERIDAEVMGAAGEKLKVISNYAVGYDNIDVREATKRGICITNTPGVLTESVAEQVITLILALYRRTVEGDNLIREKKYKGWEPDLLLGTTVRGKVLGIVGLGRIGRWTARIAKAMGMKVIYFNRTRDEEFEAETGTVHHTFETLLEMSDVVSLSVPLSSETHYMIDTAQLKKMKKTSLLINTARGGVVNTKSLIEALKNKEIAGAGLDVFEDEMNIPDELLKMKNVILTPHTASATVEAREAMARVLVDNLQDALEGRQPSCLINPREGDSDER